MNFFRDLYSSIIDVFKGPSNILSEIKIDLRSPIFKALSPYEIYSYFKQFGEVKNVNKSILGYAVVEFTTPQEADIALLRQGRFASVNLCYGYFRKGIARCACPYCRSTKVRIKIKVDDILLRPPDTNSPKNIINILNADCLEEIFKKLHLSNYASIADVCIRFNEIIERMITRKYKNRMFSISDLELIPLSQADDYIRHFGSMIFQAEIDGKKLKCSNSIWTQLCLILGMMGEHCENLRHLIIVDLSLDIETVEDVMPLFMRIEKLSIKITNNPSIVIELPEVNLPKLSAFEWYDGCQVKNDSSHLTINFLHRHSQLESILYCFDVRYECSRRNFLDIFPYVGNFKNLKKLSIVNSGTYDENSVKKYFGGRRVVTIITVGLVSKNVPIECLRFINEIIDNGAIRKISQIKTIKKFAFVSFQRCLPSNDIIESYIIHLESALPNLEILLFQTSSSIEIVFTDESIHLIEKELLRIEPQIKLHIEQFKSTTDIFTGNENTPITILNTCQKSKLRKFSVRHSNVQRYWLTHHGSYTKPIMDI